jgi:hypothetical protein
MRIKRIIASFGAAALAFSPAVAAAQSVAPIIPAEETVEGSELRGGFIIPLVAIVAIILGVLAALGELEGDGNGPPKSP